MNSRYCALEILCRVIIGGQSLGRAIPKVMATEQDNGLIQEMSYGVLRWYEALSWIVDQLLDKPLKAKDQDIRLLIMLGLYQLVYLRIPDHAAIFETVQCADLCRKKWARGLINGVLRHFQRQQTLLLQQLHDDPVLAAAHPTWLLQRLQQSYPESWQVITKANNQHPQMSLRVNVQHHTRDAYLALLEAKSIGAVGCRYAPYGLTLVQPVDVAKLPGFSQGDVSVQDQASQLAAPLLRLSPGLSILDACAAPGGKLASILEQQSKLSVVAIDKDKQRVEQVYDNLQRLQLTATIKICDVQQTDNWWDGKLFDRILLDAPCSATGVIRRHPDIKRLRRESDIIELVRCQQQLLAALWPLLAVGGILLYATCSLLPEENSQVMQNFLQRQPDAIEDKIVADWGLAQPVGRQILPGEAGMDGFYYARLYKQA